MLQYIWFLRGLKKYARLTYKGCSVEGWRLRKRKNRGGLGRKMVRNGAKRGWLRVLLGNVYYCSLSYQMPLLTFFFSFPSESTVCLVRLQVWLTACIKVSPSAGECTVLCRSLEVAMSAMAPLRQVRSLAHQSSEKHSERINLILTFLLCESQPVHPNYFLCGYLKIFFFFFFFFSPREKMVYKCIWM